MTHIAFFRGIPNPIDLLPRPRKGDVTYVTVWLVVVILVAVILLVLTGCTPSASVAAVGGAGLIAGKLRRDLS